VLKHEHCRELCAAASIGQATPEELYELEQHAAECDSCGQAYFDYLNLAAQQFAAADRNPTLSPRKAQQALNSELFTRRFFERAEREGIRFSSDVGETVRQITPISPPLPRRLLWETHVRAVAAVMLLALTLSFGYFYGRRSLPRTSSDLQAKSSEASGVANPVPGLDQRIAALSATNVNLQGEIDQLKAELARATEQLRRTETDLDVTSEGRQKLASNRDALETQLKSVQEALAQSQALAATAHQEAVNQRDDTSEVEVALIAGQAKIHDLTDELRAKSAILDQERQLLALGHDVSDLMGARNLHIVDVVDTDPKGKTRPAFGRVFFTEGKSLVFYAYDLNGTKIQKADYQYRVWAKQEGGDKQVRNLGIFYSDDKTQRRWVFKCDDPKILNEIDSVFVTIEPTGSDPTRPNGQNLMYAYLRGQPNHP